MHRHHHHHHRSSLSNKNTLASNLPTVPAGLYILVCRSLAKRQVVSYADLKYSRKTARRAAEMRLLISSFPATFPPKLVPNFPPNEPNEKQRSALVTLVLSQQWPSRAFSFRYRRQQRGIPLSLALQVFYATSGTRRCFRRRIDASFRRVWGYCAVSTRLGGVFWDRAAAVFHDRPHAAAK